MKRQRIHSVNDLVTLKMKKEISGNHNNEFLQKLSVLMFALCSLEREYTDCISLLLPRLPKLSSQLCSDLPANLGSLDSNQEISPNIHSDCLTIVNQSGLGGESVPCVLQYSSSLLPFLGFVLGYSKTPIAATEQRLNLPYESAHYDTGGTRTRDPVH